METKKKNQFNFKLLKRILSYSKPYKKLFFLAIALTLMLSSLAIVRPLLINKMLNCIGAVNPSDAGYLPDSEKAGFINYMGLILLGVLLTEALLQFTNIYVTNLLGQNIIKDLRLQVYTHILKLKNTYFDNTPVGTLVTRAISDIESLSDVFSQGFIVICGDILMLIIFITAMLLKNWAVALVTLSTIPLLLIATNLFKNGVKKTFTEVRNAVASLNAFTNEHISGMRIVQLFNRENAEYEKFKEINQKHKAANIRSIWYYSVFFPVVEILSAVSIALFIWFAGLKSNEYNIQLGDITFFIMMINMVFRPIRMLADRLNTLQMGIVASERVFNVIDTNEIIPESGTISAKNIKGLVEFKNVWFAYKGEDYVIKGISFTIEAGETVAIIGATGAGKSSIINLLSRFYEINKGEILIDGVKLPDYHLNELRESVGVVLQDVFLFSGSILNNITLHNPLITEEKVITAAKKIGIHEFIAGLPGGYHYNVKERGAMLSAGQRQLVAFVRAYVYDPPIFVLDEATSSIDLETEKLIQKASIELAKNRTSIIIAHRLSTIHHANKIIVMEKGEIIEQGKTSELSDKVDGVYKKMLELI
ncbi:MAG: antibiotic transporter ATP-binding protein [Bacteroidetes bacterium]|jgi:ABC-type multidrug transport system fused ATPase/permease subunit|nr:antibiotic transporter ATP-binding protein [Bacteroidota bacterium]MDF2452534.1 antibiotic transporter ATP-binding protein [Bacteroidota bacterium]